MKMTFYIYDETNEKIGMLQDVFSIMWMSRYYETGTVEIHARDTKENRKVLKIGNRIIHPLRGEICFIDSVSFTKEDESMTISGRMNNLNLRINTATKKIVRMSDVLELVRSNLRGLDLSIGKLYGEDVQIQQETTWQPIDETIEELCQKTGTGFRVVFSRMLDGSKNLLELYHQDKNTDVIFDEKFGNVFIESLQNSVDEYKNFAYVAGEGEGASRKVIEVDKTNGEIRRELYIDARDIQKEDTDENGNEIIYSDEQIEKMLIDRGLEELAEHKNIEEHEIKINPLSTLFILGRDFDLGDVVKVSSSVYGFTEWMRITGINFVYEETETIEILLNKESEEAYGTNRISFR